MVAVVFRLWPWFPAQALVLLLLLQRWLVWAMDMAHVVWVSGRSGCWRNTLKPSYGVRGVGALSGALVGVSLVRTMDMAHLGLVSGLNGR